MTVSSLEDNDRFAKKKKKKKKKRKKKAVDLIETVRRENDHKRNKRSFEPFRVWIMIDLHILNQLAVTPKQLSTFLENDPFFRLLNHSDGSFDFSWNGLS